MCLRNKIVFSIDKNPPAWGIFYDSGHGSVYSYIPVSSEYDVPAGTYIMQVPSGVVAKHDAAVPAVVVPVGQDVAIVK